MLPYPETKERGTPVRRSAPLSLRRRLCELTQNALSPPATKRRACEKVPGEPPFGLHVVLARSGPSEGKCHDQDNRQCPGKVARTISRLGPCGPRGAPINRIFVDSACCEFRSSRALGISIGASKGSTARQCELVSSALIYGRRSLRRAFRFAARSP